MSTGPLGYEDDEYDDDLLAPTLGGVSGDGPQEAEHSDDVPAADFAGGEPDEGEGAEDATRDSKRTVWLRYDGDQLVGVRVNSNWTSKLRTIEELEVAFQEAFAAAMLTLADVEVGQEDLSELEFPDLPDFGPESLEAYLRMMDDHEAAWKAAIDRAAKVEQKPQPIQGKAKGVTVTLSPGGMPATAEFDRKWILNAQPGQIANQVLKAATRAQAMYVPPKHPMADELAQFERERRVLQAGFHALLNQPR
ncbi:hypothetical protein [uncultured Tessaracoccus sp.]|uniref:hypothetical protein n=1 Tax=uncultured Tessaracoccus sp. TaxID=905023 RepID=UPI0026222F86|nr:hypothetical protein [uncultured Tessaracoccus sp.]